MEPRKAMKPPEEGPLKIGQLFLGKFEIRSFLGQGGHAWVYHGCHRFLGTHVAIKILHREGGVSDDLKRRGLAEGQILQKLDHPNIVKLLDLALTDAGLLYMIMELLRGRSLRNVLEEHGRLEVEEVLRIALSVAEAMQVAHEASVIHRDIKPDNVFLTVNNHVKVIDFGVAKVEAEQAGWVTGRDVVLGTLFYMSPEQVQAHKLTPKSDIYALGVLMYEALFQHPVLWLLRGKELTQYSVYTTIVADSVPRLDQLDLRNPSDIAELVGVALNKKPNQRYASMKDFADAIRKCLKNYEAAAHAAGRSLQTRDLSRRVVTASGVEKAGGPQPPDSDVALDAQDTHPASGPMILGAVPSSKLSTQAAGPVAPTLATPKLPALQAPPESPAQRPTVRDLPNALRPLQERSEDSPHDAPAVRTAPLGAQSPAARGPDAQDEHRANPASLQPVPVRERAHAEQRKPNEANLPPVIVNDRAHPVPGPAPRASAQQAPAARAALPGPPASPAPAPVSAATSGSPAVEGAPSPAEPSGIALVPAGVPSPPSLGRLFALGSLAGVVLFGGSYYLSSRRASIPETSQPSAITVESVTQVPVPSASHPASARDTETVAPPEPAPAEPAATPATAEPPPLPPAPRAAKPVVTKAKPVDKVEERVRRLEEELRKQKAPPQPSSSSKRWLPIYE